MTNDVAPITKPSNNNLLEAPRADNRNDEAHEENDTSSEAFPLQAGCIRARNVDRKWNAIPAASVYSSHHLNEWNPYAPFKSAIEWQTVVLAIEQRLRKHEIDQWIKKHLWQAHTFQSAEHLWNLMDNINDALGPQSWKRQELIVDEDSGPVSRPFYYRNPLECIQLLLRHLPFKKHLTWAPRREYTDESQSQRVYYEMYTGDYWWTEHEKLPPGETLVPLICGSDKTLLTTMAGNQSAWPVYITVGNLSKQI